MAAPIIPAGREGRTVMIRTPSLRSLELFSTLMLTRSLTETAKRIGITQPAASLALKELEAQTGLSLFQRSRQRIVPTPQAEALLPHIERLLAQAEAVQRRITTLQDTSVSTLQIACIPSFGSTLLPQAIAGFKRKNRHLQIRVDVQHFARVLDLVDHDTTELGFAYITEPSAGTDEPLLTVQLSCLMAEEHPLASRKIVRLKDLADHTVIAATKGYIPIPPSVLAYLQQNDERPNAGLMEVNNVYTAMALAREGIGVALANPILLLSGHAGGLVGRPFETGHTLTLGVLRSASGKGNAAAAAFIEQTRLTARLGATRLGALGITAKAE